MNPDILKASNSRRPIRLVVFGVAVICMFFIFINNKGMAQMIMSVNFTALSVSVFRLLSDTSWLECISIPSLHSSIPMTRPPSNVVRVLNMVTLSANNEIQQLDEIVTILSAVSEVSKPLRTNFVRSKSMWLTLVCHLASYVQSPWSTNYCQWTVCIF